MIELCCSHCGFGMQMLRLAGPKQFSQYTLQMPWKLKDNVRRFSLRVPLTVFQTSFATIQINLPRMLHDLRRDPSRSNMCSALAAEHGFLALRRK